MIVIVPIPLLDLQEDLEVFQVHSLPLANMHPTGAGPPMTAQYELEARAIAINRGRTKVALLKGKEVSACVDAKLGFCAIRSPIYPMFHSQFCVTALFKDDSRLVQQNCQVNVKLNSTLPQAEYIADGRWMVSTIRPLTFSVMCPDQSHYMAKVRPPMGVVMVNMSCVGTSEALTLTPYFQQESTVSLNDAMLNTISHYALSNATLWEPLYRLVPRTTPIQLPDELKDISEINLDPLLQRLHSLRANKPVVKQPWWEYVMWGLGIGLTIVVICVVIYVLMKYKLVRGTLPFSPFTGWCNRQRKSTAPMLASVVAEATSAKGAEGATAPSPDEEEGEAREVTTPLYPPLCRHPMNYN